MKNIVLYLITVLSLLGFAIGCIFLISLVFKRATKKPKTNYNKLEFDEYFKFSLNENFISWYGVKYKGSQVFEIHKGRTFGMCEYELSATVLENVKGDQITKEEFLKAYDEALEYYKQVKP